MPNHEFAWLANLAEWCTLRILFARGWTWQDMVQAAFGLDPTTAIPETLLNQTDHPDHESIRGGEHGGWGYTVQVTVDPGDNEEVQLGRLSLRGEAFALTYTMTIDSFSYASDGSSVWSFDMTLPHLRRVNPRFEASIVEAGFLDDGALRRISSARFVQLAFGITLTREMIEGPLPSVMRPTPPPGPLHPAAPPTGWSEPRPPGFLPPQAQMPARRKL